MKQVRTSSRRQSKARPEARRHRPPIVLSFPLPRTHCGFVLGNGLFGAMVWGVDRLHVTINRADFWDHRAGQCVDGENLYEQIKDRFDPDVADSADAPLEATVQPWTGGAFRNTRLPMGRFEIELDADLTLADGSLDIERGELTIRLLGKSAGEVRRVVIALHPKLSALVVSDPQGALRRAEGKPAWHWVSQELRSRGFAPPEVIGDTRCCGWVQTCPDDPAMAAMCDHTGEDIVITMSPGDDASAAIDAARSSVADVRDIGHELFFDQVHAWWHDYWCDVPRLDLPDPFFEQFSNLALYKFGAATSPRSPLPCALQGPWCEEYQLPPWAGDYHFNVNIQQIYRLAFAAGKSDHLLPLFDMLDRCRERFRLNARSMLGIDDGLLMTHTTDDRGYACGGIGAAATIDQAVTGWVAQLYWLYFQHTGDIAFLRDRAMPFMIGAMRTYEAMVEWVGDRPTLPASISAEYGKPLPNGKAQRVGASPSSQLACMQMLLGALIDASQRLGRPPRQKWLRLRERLPHWTLIGEGDDRRIAIWQGADLDISHRHHSHLSCVYPFDSLGKRTPEMKKIVARSLRRWLEVGMSDWSEWSLPWAATIQAREGYREGPALLLKMCRDIFVNEGLATAYIPRASGITLHGLKHLTGPIETCEIMQLDGTMGFATAVYEMLVHMHGGVIRFFPAVPRHWRRVAFSNIHLPGGLTAEGEITRGRVTHVALRSARDCDVTLDVPGYPYAKVRRDAAQQTMALPTSLHLTAGERVTVKPCQTRCDSASA